MTILVIGATGTLGRQIVRQALQMGYPVKCGVRNLRKASFLREWGAELVYADLKLPETLPNVLKDVSVVVDAATLRPDDEIGTTKEVDLIGKLALIKAAKLANVKRFIFFSIINNDKFDYVPLMNLKSSIESNLRQSEIPYTIFQLSGFFQGLIAQYAIPILDKQTIWSTQDTAKIAYMDTQDVAKFCLRSLVLPETSNKTYLLGGPKSWLSSELISVCEKLSGQEAEISFIPLFSLGLIKTLAGFSKWSWSVTDRLAFAEVLSENNSSSDNINEAYKVFGFEPNDLLSLEDYLKEYFATMLKKLRDLNYDQSQAARRKDLTF
jgi:uncharacterized protein YbjT (DUF2867 family)|tara:strand:- start:25551 stop:26519 length:969 start_codon:yes stop_codon:yes gene_type:complete